MAHTELARLKAHATNQRKKAQEVEHAIVRKSLIAVTAAGIGFAEKKGAPVSIAGIPLKLALATLGTVGETMSHGSTRRMLGAFGDTALAIYTHDAVKAGAFIAGEDEVSGEGGSI